MQHLSQAATPLQTLISRRILPLRDQRVILDADLAELYDVQTKVLVQAVKRNLARFPSDFMFQLSPEEFAVLRSQTVTSKPGSGGRRTAPYAFTEQGVAMLSSVLSSPRAIAARLGELEEKTEAISMQHDTFSRNTRNQLKKVFDTLRELMTPLEPVKRPIGFVLPQEQDNTKKTN